MLHIFRVENSATKKQLKEKGRQALVDELKAGRLRQGWGFEGFQLLNPKGVPYTHDEWSRRYLEATDDWEAKEHTERKVDTNFTLLSNMLSIKPGDRIVVPNVAEKDRDGFVIATAKRAPGRKPGAGECYSFSPLSETPKSLNGDRRHIVWVDPLKSEWISYDRNEEADCLPLLIKKKGFQQRVRPVDPKKNLDLIEVINRLSKLGPIDPEDQPAKPSKKKKNGSRPPTETQQERGLKGEKEAMRRLKLKNGCLGLRYVDDHRDKGWGYDILCTDGSQKVEVEVKTYLALTGQIFITDREFKRSLESKSRYHLWAFQDNGGDPRTWTLVALPTPYDEIKRVGKKEKRIVYRMRPAHIKWIETHAGEKPVKKA